MFPPIPVLANPPSLCFSWPQPEVSLHTAATCLPLSSTVFALRVLFLHPAKYLPYPCAGAALWGWDDCPLTTTDSVSWAWVQLCLGHRVAGSPSTRVWALPETLPRPRSAVSPAPGIYFFNRRSCNKVLGELIGKKLHVVFTVLCSLFCELSHLDLKISLSVGQESVLMQIEAG